MWQDPDGPVDREQVPETLSGAVAAVARHPLHWLVRHWNWKAAVVSAVLRASIFFSVNLTVSWTAATGAAITELLYRAPMVGTLASLSQAFRRVEPAWKASLAIVLVLPALGHAIEFTVHSLRGTPRLYESVGASVGFSAFSCVLSYWLHRRGVLITGHGSRPFRTDLIELPGEILDLLLRRPLAIARAVLARDSPEGKTGRRSPPESG